jgi:hypothetical protein
MKSSLRCGVSCLISKAGRGALQFANRLCSRADAYAGADVEEEEVAPLFVVGLPRSGTTLVYELIAQAFEVSYFSHMFDYTYGLPNVTTRLTSRLTRNPEPKYESSYGRIPGFFSPAENHTFWMRWFPERSKLGHYVPGELMNDDLISSMNRAVGSITRISGRPYVFKDVYFTLSIPSLTKAFSRAKVVIVRRDLEAIAASLYKRRCELHKTLSWWSIKPPFSDDYIGKEMLEQVAFQCVRTEQLMDRALSEVGSECCFSVSYSEVCNSPQHFIASLGDWLGEGYRLRSVYDLPESFEQRGSVGFSSDQVQRFCELVRGMYADKEGYMERLDGQVKSLLCEN